MEFKVSVVSPFHFLIFSGLTSSKKTKYNRFKRELEVKSGSYKSEVTLTALCRILFISVMLYDQNAEYQVLVFYSTFNSSSYNFVCSCHPPSGVHIYVSAKMHGKQRNLSPLQSVSFLSLPDDFSFV